MANRLKMAKVHSIQVLHARRWSQRRIARELGVHRETVGPLRANRGERPVTAQRRRPGRPRQAKTRPPGRTTKTSQTCPPGSRGP